MNNKRPALGEQLLRSLLLSFVAMWFISYFFGWPGQPKNNQQVTRDAKLEQRATLPNAFEGLNGAALAVSAEKAKSELVDLQKQITQNSGDKYAYWARLRAGLLQQYVLNDWAGAQKHYDEIIKHGSPDAIDAQAIFQKGNWQWFNASDSTEKPTPASTFTPLPTRQDAVWTLETLIHRGRASAGYEKTEIYVPVLNPSNAQTASESTVKLPSEGFKTAKVESLKGTLENPAPLGILDRINIYYAPTFLNRNFDALVNALGAKPEYSYGLAIVILAVLLRILMQPINRKQYDSMKGLQKIGPEMKKIQDKHKAKPSDSPEVQREKQMKAFSEVRALQKEHGVNPQMGCALMFVQLPIFFYVINPLMMHYEPKMNLVGASFLWVQNLAHPDYILLGLYGLSMLVSFRLSSTPPTDEMQRQMQLMSTFVMPLMLPFFMKGFSSAFILYWMVFNCVSMVFQYRMMKGSDPDKSVMGQLLGRNLLTPVEVAEGDAKNPSAPIPPRPKSGSAKAKNQRAIKSLMPGDENAAAEDENVAEKPTKTAPVVKKIDASQIIPSNGVPHTNGSTNGANGSHSDENGKTGKTDGAKTGNTGNSAQRARRRRRY